jgi:hypothetical protein
LKLECGGSFFLASSFFSAGSWFFCCGSSLFHCGSSLFVVANAGSFKIFNFFIILCQFLLGSCNLSSGSSLVHADFHWF